VPEARNQLGRKEPQPWELAIHTPDLLASLYGVSEFLEGTK